MNKEIYQACAEQLAFKTKKEVEAELRRRQKIYTATFDRIGALSIDGVKSAMKEQDDRVYDAAMAGEPEAALQDRAVVTKTILREAVVAERRALKEALRRMSAEIVPLVRGEIDRFRDELTEEANVFEDAEKKRCAAYLAPYTVPPLVKHLRQVVENLGGHLPVDPSVVIYLSPITALPWLE